MKPEVMLASIQLHASHSGPQTGTIALQGTQDNFSKRTHFPSQPKQNEATCSIHLGAICPPLAKSFFAPLAPPNELTLETMISWVYYSVAASRETSWKPISRACLRSLASCLAL